MGKREQYIRRLVSYLENRGLHQDLELFLISNSNLPGPRANLELAFAFGDCFEQIDVSSFDVGLLQKWASITEKEAKVNDPMAFLPFCAVIALGTLYVRVDDALKAKIISILKRSANDGRWRMREATAIGFQRIAEKDFSVIVALFSTWRTAA